MQPRFKPRSGLCIAMLCLALLQTACASKPADPQENIIKGELHTRVVSGDIRLFRFVVNIPELSVTPITQTNRGGHRRNTLQNRAELQKKQLQNMEEALKDRQELKAFCPNGFIVIERYAILNELVIRGECKYK